MVNSHTSISYEWFSLKLMNQYEPGCNIWIWIKAWLYPGCWICDMYMNLQKSLSSSYCRSQICSPIKGVGTGCSGLQHYMHCGEEFALPVLAACHKLFPASSCSDLIKRNSSINHRYPFPYRLRLHRAFQATAMSSCWLLGVISDFVMYTDFLCLGFHQFHHNHHTSKNLFLCSPFCCKKYPDP
jgi:hypothetical protein